jgi:hypothetical protein
MFGWKSVGRTIKDTALTPNKKSAAPAQQIQSPAILDIIKNCYL